MKKIVYALIAVLLLGTFVACNGDVNSSLFGKTLTLILDEDSIDNGYSFAKGPSVKEKNFTVGNSVTTWKELIDSGVKIIVYKDGITLTVTVKEGNRFGVVENPEQPYSEYQAYFYESSKGSSIRPDSQINFDVPYELAIYELS